ncbi:hypothetical protein [uncultured Dokdonia sp.]|nr:hypothetical protein [uncultured Dokdonia sp.]
MKNLKTIQLTSIIGGQSSTNRATDWENVLLRDATLENALLSSNTLE